MGMYDDIRCEYPLPSPEDPQELKDFNFNSLYFHTKDLDNCLDLYTIQKDGTLIARRVETEYVKGDKNSELVGERIGYVRVIREWFEPISNYTGTILFYDDHHNDELKNDYWVEYVAIFMNGKLTQITLHKFEYSDNTERKEMTAKWNEKRRLRNLLWSKWYMRYGYGFYDMAIDWCFRQWYRLSQKLPSSHRVEQWLRPL